MNRTWSVLTMPYFVCTLEPSTIGSRSRCTPSRETSGPPSLPRSPAILSISSRKMMPMVLDALERVGHDVVHVDELRRTPARAGCGGPRAGATVRRFFRLGSMSCSISVKFIVHALPSPAAAASSPNTGEVLLLTSTSTSRSSSCPSLSSCAAFRACGVPLLCSASASVGLAVTSPFGRDARTAGVGVSACPCLRWRRTGGGSGVRRRARAGAGGRAGALRRARAPSVLDLVLALGRAPC